jgi:hypothetical protein
VTGRRARTRHGRHIWVGATGRYTNRQQYRMPGAEPAEVTS